jgi:hypothetical protein
MPAAFAVTINPPAVACPALSAVTAVPPVVTLETSSGTIVSAEDFVPTGSGALGVTACVVLGFVWSGM